MAERLSSWSRRQHRGALAGAVAGAVTLGGIALGTGGAAAQTLPLRPTDAGATLAQGTTDDTSLRGSVLGLDPMASPDDATAPQEPVGPQPPQGPVPRPRPFIAGQGSALLAPPVGPPRLPALQPYPSSQRPVRGAAIDTIGDGAGGEAAAGTIQPLSTPLVAAPTVAALPVPTLRRRPVDTEPFAPIGYTIGMLRLTPYFEESLGYDSNPDQVSTGVKASAFSRSEGGFSLLSLWSSNELRATMSAGYDAFFSNPQADRPDASGTVDYRYDVSRDMTLDSQLRFAVSSQRPGSPEVNAAIQGRPLISSYGATVGGNETFGRLTLGLHGLIDRTEYENGRLGDGTVVPLDAQTFTDYGLAMRADYALTPTLRPFGEVVLDTRVHDDRLDASGYARNSDGVLGRLGTTFELTPLVTGTISAGYEDRHYADPRLRDLRGPVVDASLIYAVTPLTTLTLLAGTSFDETNVVGSPGVESRTVSLQVSHALLRNLVITGLVSYLNSDYIASPIEENTYSATLKASYALSRSLVLEASYNHQTLHSTAPGSSFDQDVVLLGLRVQH